MKTAVISLFAFSLLITMYSGCKGGSVTPDPVIPDTTKPTITIIKPTAGQVFVPGNPIAFQATFADNIKISSYEISISNLPTVGLILKNVPTPVAWSYAKASTSFDSGVKQQEINLSDISIPLLMGASPVATGKYYLKATCVDGSNNSFSTTVEININ